MSMIDHFMTLRAHSEWADRRLVGALIAGGLPVPDAVRELAHVRGAQEVWLSRIEGRPSDLAVWPDLTLDALVGAGDEVDAAWGRLLAGLTDADLDRIVSYTNSAGAAFETALIDILTHVMLHAQYHRGKANLALRAAGVTPAVVDYHIWRRLESAKE